MRPRVWGGVFHTPPLVPPGTTPQQESEWCWALAQDAGLGHTNGSDQGDTALLLCPPPPLLGGGVPCRLCPAQGQGWQTWRLTLGYLLLLCSCRTPSTGSQFPHLYNGYKCLYSADYTGIPDSEGVLKGSENAADEMNAVRMRDIL